MSVIEEYWAGVVRRLQAEVDVFARLVQHHGEQGRENEAALARLLEAFVPHRLGVGTGMVIDRFDQYARQADIVLYEQSDEPAVLAQTTQLLYPVESVRASIEVKTRLRTDDVRDCLRKHESLRKLQPAVSNPDGSTHPLFVVLAYEAQLSPDAIHRAFTDALDDQRPDLYCVLEPGVVGGRRGVLQGSDAEFASGLAFVRSRNGDGRRTGQFESVPDSETGESMLIDGQPHLIFSRGGKRYPGEPARALLIFVEALARRVAEQQQRPAPVVTHYLDAQTTELVWL